MNSVCEDTEDCAYPVYTFIHGVEKVLCYHACTGSHQCMLPNGMCVVHVVYRLCTYHSWDVIVPPSQHSRHVSTAIHGEEEA